MRFPQEPENEAGSGVHLKRAWLELFRILKVCGGRMMGDMIIRLKSRSLNTRSDSNCMPADELISTGRLRLCTAERVSRNFRTSFRAQAPPTKVKRAGRTVKSEVEKPSCKLFKAYGHFAVEHFPQPMQVLSLCQCQS